MAENNQQRRNRSEIAKAKADAERTRQEAAKFDAETRRTQAEAEVGRVKAAADKERRADEAAAEQRKHQREVESKGKSWGERGYQTVISVGAPVAGIAVGHKVAKALEARHVAHIASTKTQMSSLGSKARELMKPAVVKSMQPRVHAAQVAGVVSAADKLKLTKVKGPLGLVPAALLLGEGMFSRYVLANQVESEGAKEALRAVGTASVFAATNLVGERAVHNATLKIMPAATDVASIQAVRKLAGKQTVAAAVGPTATEKAIAALPSKAKFAAAVVSKSPMLRVGVKAGGVIGGLAALGYVASQTEVAKKAFATVKGFWRTSDTGKTSFVHQHERRLAR
jgi:hypothetical protein